MALRPITSLRHASMALVILVAAVVGFELWLKSRTLPSVQIVSSQTGLSDQVLLIPSPVRHHELKRLMNTSVAVSGNQKKHAFRVNSLGCRGAENDIPAPDGVYRILVLGDDSICGAGFDETDTIPNRLHQFLSPGWNTNIQVINGGVPGYCPLLSWLQFEHDLARLKPQLVIMHADMTDVTDDVRYRSLLSNEGSHSVCPHPFLRLPPQPENAMIQFLRNSATASWLYTKIRTNHSGVFSTPVSPETCSIGFAWIMDNPEDVRLQIRHALAPIRELRDAVENAGAKLVVATSPVVWQVVSAEKAPELSQRCGIRGITPYNSRFPFEILARFCEQSEIPFCDASEAFRIDEAERLFSAEAPVLSRLGMALYAREIARFLIAAPLIQIPELRQTNQLRALKTSATSPSGNAR